MKRIIFLLALAALANVSAGFAQVCSDSKNPQFIETLQTVDKKCADLTTLPVPRPRKWDSGYKYATPDERVKFALAYQDWLKQHGETGEPKDSYRLVPYTDRQAWAMHWWAKEDLNFAPTSLLDQKADWVHDALVDAGNSLHLTCQQLHPLGGDTVTKNNVEMTLVDNKKDK